MMRASLPRLGVLVTVALAAASVSVPAAAQWKWRDKSGTVHVSDLPPPRDVSDKDVLQRPAENPRKPITPAAPAAAPASATQTPSRVDTELEARRKKAEQEQSVQRQQEDERMQQARAENCKRAQAHMRALESGMRLARVNDKGEREVLDDHQRAAELQRTRQVIASDCG